MDLNDLKHRFQFHPADTENKQLDHEGVRDVCLQAAEFFDGVMPDGREKSLAVTKLEEAMMWANAGVARADGPRT
jgi:hypothetical protein